MIIQNPATARYPAMPASLDPSVVDIVADLEQIGPLLQQLLTDAYLPDASRDASALSTLLAALQDHSGIDFSRYKMPTIRRRLQRRIAAVGMASLADYGTYLRDHPEEYDRLACSFLIKVTEFFRDPQLFDYLRDAVLPDLIARASAREDRELRIWSAGCATGQEAYTIAILLAEALGPDLEKFEVRIYATDLDTQAISTARRGIYPAAALATVPAALVDSYFTRYGDEYEIKKWVRSLTVFGEHDLGQRAPFPRIDLCLCRNVLIYFTPELQARALQLFAFALRDGGYLALGSSESTRPLTAYFAPVESRLKIYRRQGERLLIPSVRLNAATPPPREQPIVVRRQGADRLLERRPPRATTPNWEGLAYGLLDLPVGVVVVDRRYDIRVLNGAARRLLGIYGTAVGDDLIHLVQGMQATMLRAAIDAAFGPAAPRSADAAGRARMDIVLPVETATGEHLSVQIACYPHTSESRDADDPAHRGDDTVLIVAIDVTQTERERRAREAADVQALKEREEHTTALREEIARLIARHREELARLSAQGEEETARLEAQAQRLVIANRSLLAANEELAASNLAQRGALDEVQVNAMEAQAANEELETLNEEMQATVEELQTANADLRARGGELEDQALALEEQRRQGEAERRRLEEILQQAPSMMAVLRGPEHRFTVANAMYLGGTGRVEEAVLGRTFLEVFPELQRPAQGLDLVQVLDQVYATGIPYSASEQALYWDRDGDGLVEEAFFDMVFQPLRAVNGEMEAILAHGVEVTSRIQARREGAVGRAGSIARRVRRFRLPSPADPAHRRAGGDRPARRRCRRAAHARGTRSAGDRQPECGAAAHPHRRSAGRQPDRGRHAPD